VIAGSLAWLAVAAAFQGDRERARTLYVDAADVARECGDVLCQATVAHGLGNIALEEGDAEIARTHFQHALELYRGLSDAGGETIALRGLSLAALAEGDTDEAAALLGNSLRLARVLRDREGIFGCLLASAELAAQRSETVLAARLLGAADALGEEIGFALDPVDREQRARIATVLEGDDAALVAAQEEGRELTLDVAVAYALGERD
jgi:tetratricopeptide (TPR) repeat protein